MVTTETERPASAGEGEGGGTAMSVGAVAAGLALIVLDILALNRIASGLLVSIAVVVGGVLLVAESVRLTQQLAKALGAKPGRGLKASELSKGVNAGVLGGITGVVLGILAILNVVPQMLVPVAVIVFGAAVVFEFAARSRLRMLRMTTAESHEQPAGLAMVAALSTGTAAMLTGVGLVTLGILAVAGIATGMLAAVGLLGLGTYALLEATVAATLVTNLIAW